MEAVARLDMGAKQGPRALRVDSVEFVTSAVDAPGFPPVRDGEVAFMGRSNVGKSSLLNVLAGRRGLARVGSTPGRTRLINFFLVNERYYFVDLPGYGYARVSKEERNRWKKIVDSYLDQRRMSLAVLLVDARIGPTPNDLMLAEWLKRHQLPHLTCVTKSDKLSRGKLLRLLPDYARDLEMEAAELLPFSARTKKGDRELRARIGAALQGGRS